MGQLLPRLLLMPEQKLLLPELLLMLELLLMQEQLLKQKLLQMPELGLLLPRLLLMPELLRKQDKQEQEPLNCPLLSKLVFKLVRTLLVSAGTVLSKQMILFMSAIFILVFIIWIVKVSKLLK